MCRKPGINTGGMKGMSAIIENAHMLALFDRILADRAIIIHGTRSIRKSGMLMNLIRGRMNGNRMVEKVLERGSFKDLPDKVSKKSVGRGVASHPITVKKCTLRASGS